MRWFGVVAAAALGIIVLGGTGAAVLSGNSLPVVVSWLSPLWRAVQFVGTVVGVVLFQVVYPAIEVLAVVLAALINVLTRILGQVVSGLQQFGLLGGIPELDVPTPTPTPTPDGPIAILADKGGVVLLMLAAVVVVALALVRVYQQATLAARDSTASRADRADDDEPGAGRRLLERLGLLRQWRAAASIRRVYRLMCRAATAAGYPRLEAETPTEYLPTLAQVWPENAAEARLITDAFILSLIHI